ncbi:sigma-70 family RNA polymerase sigma factor [Sphingomicrobium clamense]|uniref:Sigma-70 family RNA polymerase sigma factor n=1 Tax=Sphingomicrobium clamense TaxID=2851013 RepID=A0ABS6V4R9_9SPHN|nr:sigma-70 family RNA polymerase sigma factor [Sphingomicrobium sp. B8]MBW0144550.1 sigma-70 family RNA polymerase sigma factor [Sphingomicrobium sp. B8]
MSGAPRRSNQQDRVALEAALVETGREDHGAFRTLYRLSSAKLFGICLRICGSRAAAEDVMSETYMTIWRRAGAYEPGRVSPVTWLATVARNKAIDWKRKQGRRQRTGVEEIADLPDENPAADDLILADEQSARLHLCLDKLGEDQRKAIRTAFFNGLTYSELAEKEGVALGTMKSRVRRGLMALKDCLNDDE